MAPTIDFFSLSSILVAFIAALTGSLHCVLMCGPIRMLTGNKPSARILYQSGRFFGYLILGSLAGYLGAVLPIAILIPLVLLGVSLAFLPKIKWKIWNQIRKKILIISAANPLLLGLSSALLPCGMLHAWLGVAALTTRPALGAAVLLLLWLGTLPALELSSEILKPLTPLRTKFPRAFPALFVVLALLPIAWRYSFTMQKPADTHTISATCPLHQK